MVQQLKRRIIPAIVFASLIYLGLLVYSDYTLLTDAFLQISIINFFQVLAVIFLSFVLKFYRWNYYLRTAKIQISLFDSIIIFFSGLLMSISPGKVGELLKSYLIKQKYNISISESSRIVLAERIIEFISLIFLIIITFLIQSQFIKVLIACLIAIVILVLFSNLKLKKFIKKKISSIKYIKQKLNEFQKFKEQLKTLFRPKIFLNMLIISTVAWIIECLGFFMIMEMFTDSFGFLKLSVTYLNSIFLGSISMLPGGLGATEGSLVYMLKQINISESIAITSTFLIRIVTLWFSLVLGFFSLILFQRNIKIIETNSE